MLGKVVKSGHGVALIISLVCVLVVSFATGLSKRRTAGADDFVTRVSAATGLTVKSESFFWLDSEPAADLESSISWYEVIFLAAEYPEGPGDLYRAEMRAIGPEQPFAIKSLKNLTTSQDGDDYRVVVSFPFAVVATKALGLVRSLTVFDFRGSSLPPNVEWSGTTRLLARATDILKTGRSNGIGKTTIRFTKPPKDVDLSFGGNVLLAGWKDISGVARSATVVIGEDVSSDEQLLVTNEVRLPKRPILWLVDTVRSFSWIGPGPIEWAEGRFFALKDIVKRLSYGLFGDDFEEEKSEVVEAASLATVIDLPPGREVGAEDLKATWPPETLELPVFKRRAKGEGVWRRAGPEWSRSLPDGPPPIMHTFIRPDRTRPYVRVNLFAMDMRQLELHMVAGHEDPQPTTGSCGTGRIPRNPEILTRVVAAFNGAFKTEHGQYGMMVERNVLLPPQDKAATVASLADGRTVMGSWPEKMPIPKKMLSYRQNMDPLVEDGVINPRRRYLWGFTLDEDISKMHTIRSGICLTETNNLIYARGEDLTGDTLGRAMNAAGCTYGIHLDMNPFHTSFIYYRFADEYDGKGPPEFKGKIALSEMRFSENRYVNGAPKDFFFVALKNLTPGPDWSAEDLAQPAPAFVPAVYKKDVDGCHLVAIDMTRAEALLLPGAIPEHLVPASIVVRGDGQRVLADLSLGNWSSVRGQIISGAVVAPLETDRATVGLEVDGSVSIGLWPLKQENGEIVPNALQTRWLIAGKTLNRKISAIGWLDDTWLLIGTGPGTKLAGTMQKQGVKHAVYFPIDTDAPSLVLRSEKGMIDGNGKTVTTLAATSARLKILARPRDLGAVRLETAVSIAGREATEE
jgi:hypothetical protein